ncbi:hypothetical protein TNIN_284511 [Trichonephila inaurata madagascariensis]|uniref:Uncharacterized protein n=1 Tax=Trichonephila inaurata madagascariensis TaxID=2747483 RepID=A0A8X7BX48_9ARAC|nr:hypothetical protein TNIN_284511 [Trichonephila inaurata madagascariensis]
MDKKLPGMDPRECTPREKTQMSLLENSTDLKSSAVLEEEMTSSNTTKDEMACAKTISLVFRDETFSKSNKVEHTLLQKKYLTLLKNPLKDKKIDESYNVTYPEDKSKLCNLKRKILDHKKNEGESKSDVQNIKTLKTYLIHKDAASQKLEGISHVTSRSQPSIDKLRAIVSKDLWDQPNQESRVAWSPPRGKVPKFNVDQRIDENSVPRLFKTIENLKQQLKEIIQLGSSTHNKYRKKDYINQSKETQKRIEECYVKLETRVLLERRKTRFNVLETRRKRLFQKQLGHLFRYQKPNEQQTQKQSISSTQQDYLQKLAHQGSSQQEFSPIQGVSKQPMSLSQQRISQSQVILTQQRASQQQDPLGHQETFQHQVFLAKQGTSQQQSSPAQQIASHHKFTLDPQRASRQQEFLEYHGRSQQVVQAKLEKIQEMFRLRPLEYLQKLIIMAEKGPSQLLLSLAHQVASQQLDSLAQKGASEKQESPQQEIIQQQDSLSAQGTSQQQFSLTLQKYLQNQVQLASKEYFQKLLRMAQQEDFQHQDPLEQQGTYEPQAFFENHGASQQLVPLAQRGTAQRQISPAQQKYFRKLVCLETQEYLQKLVRLAQQFGLSQQKASPVQRRAPRHIPLEHQSVQDHQAPPKQQLPVPLNKKQRFENQFSPKKPKQHLVSPRIQVLQPQLTYAGSSPINPRQLNQLPEAFISQQMQKFSLGKQQTLPGQNVALQLPSLQGHISVQEQIVKQKIINIYTLFHYLAAAYDIFLTKDYQRNYLNFEYLKYIYICLLRSLQQNSRDLELLKYSLLYNMKTVSSYLVRNQNKINGDVIATDINSINDMINFNQLLKEKMYENKDLICNILQDVKETNKLFKKIITLTRRMRFKYVSFCSKNHERLFK